MISVIAGDNYEYAEYTWQIGASRAGDRGWSDRYGIRPSGFLQGQDNQNYSRRRAGWFGRVPDPSAGAISGKVHSGKTHFDGRIYRGRRRAKSHQRALQLDAAGRADDRIDRRGTGRRADPGPAGQQLRPR